MLVTNEVTPQTVSDADSRVISATAQPTRGRIKVIDHLRGVAMLLMALDHSMPFTGITPVAESYGGVMPVLGQVPLVLVGLATNISSGIFFVLAGTSVVFFEASRRRQLWTEAQITRFFLVRAAILFALDAFIEPYAWNTPVLLDTLSGLAFCILVLAFACRLPLRVIGIASGLLFVGYPILVSLCPPQENVFGYVTTALLQFHPDSFPRVEFPLVGRLSLSLFGYFFGVLIKQDRITISNSLLWVALAGLAVALVLRLGGGYGNFLPYEPGSPWVYFFIENKQPPSIVFLLFNFSVAVLVLVWLARNQKLLEKTKLGSLLQLLGQTSLFFFAVHLLVYSKIVSNLTDLHLVTHTWELVVLEYMAGLAILIPLCAGYRRLRKKWSTSLLQYL